MSAPRINNLTPAISIPRGIFHLKTNHKTTFNVGRMIPFFCEQVLPGDEWDIQCNYLARQSTPLHPTMDNAFCDVHFFFCQNRDVYDHWDELMGENKTDKWYNPSAATVTTPKLIMPSTIPTPDQWKHTTAYYMGIPAPLQVSGVGTGSGAFNALPFKHLANIYNNYIRSQQLMDPVPLDKSNTAYAFEYNDDNNLGLYLQQGGNAPRVCKFHDMFTDCLPQPNFGVVNGVTFPMSQSSYGNDLTAAPLLLDAQLGSSTIPALRMAVQMNLIQELDARSGTRALEYLKARFGVNVDPLQLGRPLYIGGDRTPLQIKQVAQTSSTDTSSPQGNLAGFGQTLSHNNIGKVSVPSHGFIIGIAMVRTQQTYQTSCNRQFFQNSRWDYFEPALQNITDQPIYNGEINFLGNATAGTPNSPGDLFVFGYQEAFAYLKRLNNRVSGEFNSRYSQSLDSWHYAQNYGDAIVTLSSDFIVETEYNFDRTLAVSFTIADQIIADFETKITAIRPITANQYGHALDHFIN